MAPLTAQVTAPARTLVGMPTEGSKRRSTRRRRRAPARWRTSERRCRFTSLVSTTRRWARIHRPPACAAPCRWKAQERGRWSDFRSSTRGPVARRAPMRRVDRARRARSSAARAPTTPYARGSAPAVSEPSGASTLVAGTPAARGQIRAPEFAGDNATSGGEAEPARTLLGVADRGSRRFTLGRRAAWTRTFGTRVSSARRLDRCRKGCGRRCATFAFSSIAIGRGARRFRGRTGLARSRLG